MPHGATRSNEAESLRQPADPLPLKRGEIGYIETAEPPTDRSQDITSNTLVFPSRHPADRDHSSNAVIPPIQTEVVAHPSSEQSSSTASVTKCHGILDLFKPKKSPAIGGLRLSTLLIFAVQLILLGGTVAAWFFTSKRLEQLTYGGQSLFKGQPSIIFVHVLFSIAVLVQLVFLERRIFRLRGERYSHLHPGEILPRYRHNIPGTSTTLAFAPWNRPPLPTYAAALSQSGVGTGDVEDRFIAVSPPPAYGNTRGSTLLLGGYSRNSPGAQNRNSALSYVSRDEQWDEVRNAEIARRLEETLNRLERPSAAHMARF